MSLDVAYSIKRLLPADQKTLYTRSPPSYRLSSLSSNPFAADFPLSENEEKGGLNISEHVVYGCLAELPWTLAMEAALQAQPWQCPRCDYELEQFDVLDQLLHRSQCKTEQRKRVPNDREATVVPSSSSRGGSDHYCECCGRHLNLSKVDILRHRRSCMKNK